VSTDEAQNLWAVSHTALYLLRPGQSTFRRYTAADGLNIANAASPGIMNVAGGHANEVFVGYNGADVSGLPQANGDPAHDAILKKGGIDHVSLNADGTLTVVHPDVHSDDYVVTTNGVTETDFSYYEDRGTRRMLYDHHFHPGSLFVGWNHGVNRFDWGTTDPITHLPYADHVHPIVTSQTSGGVTEWMGEWRGLALDPTHSGMLWMGGQYTGGALNWTAGLYPWTCQRQSCNPANNFYRAWAKAYGTPLFPVQNDGDSMNIRAAAVTSDGTVYFASGPQWNPPFDPVYGVAVVTGWSLTYLDPISDLHLPSKQLMDMVAMPDGTLAFAVLDAGLFRYNPTTHQTFQVTGVPNHINMLYLDTTVSPAALYAATDQGFTVVRDSP
jgi:hypothetical protein